MAGSIMGSDFNIKNYVSMRDRGLLLIRVAHLNLILGRPPTVTSSTYEFYPASQEQIVIFDKNPSLFQGPYFMVLPVECLCGKCKTIIKSEANGRKCINFSAIAFFGKEQNNFFYGPLEGGNAGANGKIVPWISFDKENKKQFQWNGKGLFREAFCDFLNDIIISKFRKVGITDYEQLESSSVHSEPEDCPSAFFF